MTNTNISDLSPQTVNNGGALSLPIRGEKIITSFAAQSQYSADQHVTAALKHHTQYVTIRLKGRGGAAQGVYDAASSACYQFLINPSEVQVHRQTLDEQAYSRGGWQIGVWGEDFVNVSLSGKTPGKYFMYGLTDFYTPYSASYRNLLALEMVFENNGYWYEGEQTASALSGNTKYIKMHQDVELTVSEFVWYGMFDSLEITEDADSPYFADFNLNFVAWRESFRPSTPYRNAIGGEVQLGHVPVLVKPVTKQPAPMQMDTTPVAPIMSPSEGMFSQPA